MRPNRLSDPYSAPARTATTAIGLKKTSLLGGVIAALVLTATWLTSPNSLGQSDLPLHEPDAVAGERIFWAAGCASCHATPVDGRRAKGEDSHAKRGFTQWATLLPVFPVHVVCAYENS
jgi:hypothetical protein